MLNIEYNGIQGVVTGEQSIDGIDFVMWSISLSDGRSITVPMYQCIVLTQAA